MTMGFPVLAAFLINQSNFTIGYRGFTGKFLMSPGDIDPSALASISNGFMTV
jgi:hypothetical protein